ncbi:MAG: serine/threonine protein kinase [Pirellulaceae bacterium]|nr:MAG: serine/threonine protein kinase [Pirellulaceae bacterium]
MASDFTQQQSLTGLRRAEELSLQLSPPAEIPGYQVERLLGQGAFGQVWYGTDRNTGRPVAIKFYTHPGAIDTDVIDREVRHLVSMSTGRHIVQILAVGWDAEPPYYVMEYLENGSLEDLIRARGALDVSEAVQYLRSIAVGLSYAHSKGIFHCDLKPANVMLDHDWQPRIADFGQSRMSDDQSPSLGTLFFMAPEQADLEAIPDASWDVYALGAIGYCMLVGSPPHRSPDIVETLDTADSLSERLRRYRETIRSAPRPRLHYRRRGIDKALCQIIDRCLAVDPAHRFANVQQVIEAIDARNRARARRPLYIMGVIGPILFLMAMLFFFSRSILVAKQESLERVHQWAVESNLFAAQLAAQTMKTELEALFRLVEAESNRDQLRQLIRRVTTEEREALDRIAETGADAAARQRLLDSPAQQALSEYLHRRMASILQASSGSAARQAIFNSLFVNDNRGTNIGAHFVDSTEVTSGTSVGRNFAYRSYFNGMRADGPRDRPPTTYHPTRTTHLSASFRSTSTGKWKVGISTPIWPSNEDAAVWASGDPVDHLQPLGVLVLTINLGEFDLLASEMGDPSEHFASLVDGRPGNGQGTLLQHPYLAELEKKGERPTVVPQIERPLLDRLRQSRAITDYVDPASRFEGGERFSGPWIAAMEQVELPRRPGAERTRTASDLWVLVQERAAAVAAPVVQLGNRLQRESYIAIASVLAVAVILWFAVLRIGQQTLRGVWGTSQGGTITLGTARSLRPRSSGDATPPTDQ